LAIEISYQPSSNNGNQIDVVAVDAAIVHANIYAYVVVGVRLIHGIHIEPVVQFEDQKTVFGVRSRAAIVG